ncbi:MAG: ATP-dependent helicase HrpB [Victivallaceae bacterium]|nr:ATP-dependent helicase HrpB [Victivallaceae bacterium]
MNNFIAQSDLPVKAVLPELLSALNTLRRAVLTAAPGAGKTTLAPPALALRPDFKGKVALIEPRRMAARAAAHRIARLSATACGDFCGYTVRGDSRVGANTRIQAMTPGVFLRILQDDPELSDFGAVIFDEFHERGLESDFALTLTWDVANSLRNDLEILVMSATLDAARLSEFLQAPIIDTPGKMFPVERLWSDGFPDLRNIAPATAKAVNAVWQMSTGDILVFLPGIREIDAVRTLLMLPHDKAEILTLHGSMPQDEQDKVLAPAPVGKRKVVLATNIAESSLTIDGVTAVVDSGLERRMRFDPASGLSFLETVRISRASAEQRAGRAGRTAPGIVLRLWNAKEHNMLCENIEPEIVNGELTSLRLQLAAWGASADALHWLTPPPAGALAAAASLLNKLGATNGDGTLTVLGRKLSQLPLHPRLGAMMLAARDWQLSPLAAEIAALLEERDRGDRSGSADIGLRVREMRRRPERFRNEETVIRQLLALEKTAYRTCDVNQCGRLIGTAYPEWISASRKSRSGNYLCTGGRGAKLMPGDDLAACDFLAAARLEGSGSDSIIKLAAPLTRDEIDAYFARLISNREVCALDLVSGRVRAAREICLGEIVLSSAAMTPPPEAVAMALLEATPELPPPESAAARRLMARVRLLSQEDPAIEFPDRAKIIAAALPFVAGMNSLDAVNRLDWCAVIRSLFSYDQLSRLDAEFPEEFRTPAGCAHKIDYEAEIPTVSARVQEFYGLKVHPSVGKKRLPLRLVLLSPAQRPIQITVDIVGFWHGSWELVRKEMRGRYPKHLWPDDPAESTPTTRAKPRGATQ